MHGNLSYDYHDLWSSTTRLLHQCFMSLLRTTSIFKTLQRDPGTPNGENENKTGRQWPRQTFYRSTWYTKPQSLWVWNLRKLKGYQTLTRVNSRLTDGLIERFIKEERPLVGININTWYHKRDPRPITMHAVHSCQFSGSLRNACPPKFTTMAWKKSCGSHNKLFAT